MIINSVRAAVTAGWEGSWSYRNFDQLSRGPLIQNHIDPYQVFNFLRPDILISNVMISLYEQYKDDIK